MSDEQEDKKEAESSRSTLSQDNVLPPWDKRYYSHSYWTILKKRVAFQTPFFGLQIDKDDFESFWFSKFDPDKNDLNYTDAISLDRDSRKIIDKAEESGKKLVVGYILRHHPIWKKFIIESKKLGKPVAMRMNLNQQSSGETWDVHKNLLASLSPIVDCGVHYLDVMCQITESKPVSVSAIGVRLSDDIPNDNYNYGQLQIRFEDGSVGWYEAGWGPMISETAFFVKDVIGPKGSVSIVSDDDVFKKDSDNLENHTKNNCLKIHSSELDKDQKFVSPNRKVVYDEDPSHQDLCDYEQQYFYKSIIEDLNLKSHMEDAYKSLQIALACDEAVKKSTTIYLD